MQNLSCKITASQSHQAFKNTGVSPLLENRERKKSKLINRFFIPCLLTVEINAKYQRSCQAQAQWLIYPLYFSKISRRYSNGRWHCLQWAESRPVTVQPRWNRRKFIGRSFCWKHSFCFELSGARENNTATKHSIRQTSGKQSEPIQT